LSIPPDQKVEITHPATLRRSGALVQRFTQKALETWLFSTAVATSLTARLTTRRCAERALDPWGLAR